MCVMRGKKERNKPKNHDDFHGIFQCNVVVFLCAANLVQSLWRLYKSYHLGSKEAIHVRFR